MLATLLLVFAPAIAPEIQVPENEGWVTDRAGLLEPEQERSLEALMESYRSGTGHEIALLTLPDLGGETIERTALEVGRAWGVGREGENDGALLVVAKAERKLRIEVGRGLEGGLTDSISGRIIRDVIRPRFRAGDFYGGLRAGIEAMHAAIGGDYGPIERTASSRQHSARGFALVFFALMMVAIAIASRNRRRRGGRYAHAGVPWWLLMMGVGHSGRHGGSGGSGGFGGGGFSGGGGFGGFGGGGGFSGGGASGGW